MSRSRRSPIGSAACRSTPPKSATTYASRAEQIVADPQRLADVQQRRARLRELVRKYGPTLADVHTYAREARDRIAELERHDERAATLAATIAQADRHVAQAAETLSAARLTAAGPLARAVERHLRQLAMPAATFEVAVEAGDFVTAGDDGADEVTFLLAPNPGEPARPLARAASGGELARAMLALRVVLSVAPPTLVFDEVDAGIGGEAGTAVGQALATLGGRHQVLCVTHLPQVAAFADAHIAVSKAEIGAPHRRDRRTRPRRRPRRRGVTHAGRCRRIVTRPPSRPRIVDPRARRQHREPRDGADHRPADQDETMKTAQTAIVAAGRDRRHGAHRSAHQGSHPTSQPR